MIRTFIGFFIALLLVSCGDSSPGPLAGTWQVIGMPSMQTTFRGDETETMGMIEKVSYHVDGQSVIVTYKDGLMKGTAVRFVLVNPTTAQAIGMTYRKVGG
jgi:hypothetical protein